MTQITIHPGIALLDEMAGIHVTGAAPHARVRLSLRREAFRAEANAEFLADQAGTVDVSAQAPLSGDYEGIEPAGLFWSARFDDGGDLLRGMLACLTRLEPLVYTARADGWRRDRANGIHTTIGRRRRGSH